MLRLRGPRLKLARANRQTEALKIKITEAHQSGDNRLRLRLNRDPYNGRPAATAVVTQLPVFPPDISGLGLEFGEKHWLLSAPGYNTHFAKQACAF